MGKSVICFSGGGVRCNYSLGCVIQLQNLKSHIVKEPHVVSGVSSGSLIAAGLGTHGDLPAIYDTFAHASLAPRIGTCGLVGRAVHFYTGSNAFLYPNTHLSHFIDDSFSTLPLATTLRVYAADCTDLLQRRFESRPGQLPNKKALLASCSIPGVFPHVEIEGRNYIDGGAESNFPIQDITESLADPAVSRLALFSSHPWDMRPTGGGWTTPATLSGTTKSVLGALAISYKHSAMYVDDQRTLDRLQIHDAPDGPFVAKYKRNGGSIQLVDLITSDSEPTHMVDFDLAVSCYAPTHSDYAQAEQVTLATPPKGRFEATARMLRLGKARGTELHHISVKAGLCSPTKLIL